MNADNPHINDNKNNKFLCIKCNKNLASKFSLERHKTVCKNNICIQENTIRNQENTIRNRENTIRNQENTIQNQENTIQNQENTISTLNKCSKCNKIYKTKKYLLEHIKKCNGLSILACPKCMKIFSSSGNKSNHIKRNNCKAKSIIYANTPQTNITNNNNNSITNNNITNNNNFIINNFGNERTDYITFDKILNIFKNSNTIIPNYIQFKHYNKQFPENNNIKYQDDNICLIKNDSNWHLISLDILSNKLLSYNANEIDAFYNKNKTLFENYYKDIVYLEYLNSKFKYLDLFIDKLNYKNLITEIKFMIKNNVYI